MHLEVGHRSRVLSAGHLAFHFFVREMVAFEDRKARLIQSTQPRLEVTERNLHRRWPFTRRQVSDVLLHYLQRGAECVPKFRMHILRPFALEFRSSPAVGWLKSRRCTRGSSLCA